MKIKNNTVLFDKWDRHFAEKAGDAAADMVLDFKSHCRLPFIYDTCQLAHFFGVSRYALFDIVNNCGDLYRTILIPKRSGGFREISDPDRTLKLMQRSILRGILDLLSVSPYATAYHAGATLSANAEPHVGKRYLLKLDLSDFFGHIRFDAVYSAAFNTIYFPKQIGAMLTALCCRGDVLPQGAPTSPALSNLVMKNFDNNFGAWCQKHGMEYTRYCDDISVSGNAPLYPAFRKARSWLERSGYEINEGKTHFITNASRQTVTGLTVNEKLGVPSDYKRRLRQELYYARKFGAENVIRRQDLNDFISGGKPDTIGYCQYLLGKVSFVLSVDKDNEYFKKSRQMLNMIISEQTAV